MAKLIKTPAQRRWVQDMFARGFQAFVNGSQGAAPRGYRYVAQLEELGVVEQWLVTAPDGDVYDMVDPDSKAPLFIAGHRWDEFVAEARQLGLVTA